MSALAVEEILQNMRLLSLADVRSRLLMLEAKNPSGFLAVAQLFAQKKKRGSAR